MVHVVYNRTCMLIILLVLSDCQISICSLFRLLIIALHSAPAALAIQLLKSGTNFLHGTFIPGYC